jgi:hypothetical protein
MFNSKKIKELEQKLEELEFKIKYPQPFKKGDKYYGNIIISVDFIFVNYTNTFKAPFWEIRYVDKKGNTMCENIREKPTTKKQTK